MIVGTKNVCLGLCGVNIKAHWLGYPKNKCKEKGLETPTPVQHLFNTNHSRNAYIMT